MEKGLKVKTRLCQKEADAFEGVEPVSPTGLYWNSSVLSVCILVVLDFDVPIDGLPAIQLLRDIFLPINPRFSSIMVCDNNGEKQWKRVEVNIEDHVNSPTFPSNLAMEHYDDQFDEYLTQIAMVPLPQSRPLWGVHLVKYPTSTAAGHVIFKFHHALGDGYSLMGTLLSCMQRADHPSLPLTFPASRREPHAVGWYTRIITSVPKAVNVAYNTLRDYGWSLLKSSLIEDDKTPIRSANEDLEHRPMKISTMEFSLDEIKRIKDELGVTINDVVVGIICNGVRLYMQGRSENWATSQSTILVLMNTRNIGGYESVSDMLRTDTGGMKLWGNQFAFLHTPIPKSSQTDQFLDPLKFVFDANKIIKRKRSSLAFKLTAQTIEIMRKWAGPETAAGYIRKTITNSSMLLTNMVGPIEKMAIANHPIKGLYFMPDGIPQSLKITVVSYTQTLRIGIGVEKNFIDLQEFKSCIMQAFELVFNAATKGGAKMKNS